MALQGTLDTFALPDVLRLLASTKKTGRLIISGNRGSGSVWVDSGSVVGTEATGAVADAGPSDVLFELLRYGEGSFTFEAGTTPEVPNAARPVEPLLVDAEKQLVEWQAIEAVVPSMDSWVSLVSELTAEDITLSAARWKAIVAVGSGTSVTGVGHALQLGELDVCREVKELVELGLVAVSAPSLSALRTMDASMADDPAAPGTGSGASWDPFSIEIPGVAPLTASDVAPEAAAAEAPVSAESVAGATEATVDTEAEAEPAIVSVVDETVEAEKDADAHEVAKQLASLSPKAARAVAAAAAAASVEDRDAALAQADDEEEPINRGLLLKFLSSVKS